MFLYCFRFKTFEDEINKKSDTLYIVSFRGDHLVIPATEYNGTQRPKMSFMIMAPPNRTEWQQGDSTKRNPDLVTMMQIDCQVMDTKIVYIKKSSIPMPHSDSPYFSTPAPVSAPQDYSAPAGNTLIKPAK
ncbi:Cyclic AMP-dependent transcription factor ATF-6 beta [Desmophyllum pertusum]|uniref:Cyclic AMP-dependent transcription factor ATF-6 beta n=1 Tax=Desmophyllum pertusum TaxID=174260 RepID=A0A9W9YHR3_9CNID|nr:Cyclic AMP-dependent transcription factor ATF-6 beta [Desmophyllum pertusum]